MSQILISQLLAEAKRPLLSFEFFPPKDHKGFAALEQSVDQLKPTKPDFVSVTYGAGGTTRKRTLSVCDLLRDVGFDPVMPHLTCVGTSRAELAAIADDIYERGYRNIMVLRGDPPQGASCFEVAEGGLSYASELVSLLKERHPDLCFGVACYPEKHPEATSMEEDIRHLKEKLDHGASFATTQLFLDNRYYFEFVGKCRKAGITKPIIPGLMAALSIQQADRMMSLSSAAFPAELKERLENAGGKGPDAQRVGIEWMVAQIDGLMEHGVPGIHLYILNRARTALDPKLTDCIARWRG